MEFCHRLSQRTGRTYTLPSEARWEYACRAGTTTPFQFGDMISSELANYRGKVAYADGPQGVYREQTTPVGMFPANAWGLYGMHGNVWEWCLDEWNDSYEGAPTDGRAWVDVAEREKSKELVKTKLLRRLLDQRPLGLPLGFPQPPPARLCLQRRRFPCGLPPPGPFPQPYKPSIPQRSAVS